MVGQTHDLLPLRLMADLGTTEDDHEVGPKPLQNGDQFGRGTDIPDVDAQPQDPRVAIEDGLRDLTHGAGAAATGDAGDEAEARRIGECREEPRVEGVIEGIAEDIAASGGLSGSAGGC